MEFKVHEQEKKFYLAVGEWMPIVGNEITIGKHSFCATPYTPNDDFSDVRIIFSEVTSGAKLTETKLNLFDVMILDDKQKYLQFITEEVQRLARILSKRKDLDDEVLKMRDIAISRFGPKPPTEEFDLEHDSI